MAPAVIMTVAERAALIAHPNAAGKSAVWDDSPDGKFVALQAGPCPFYDKGECSVYDARPFQCRVFQCGRWDTEKQGFVNDHRQIMRVIRSDNDLRWSYDKNQRQHWPWADAHGWSRA
jgi:Fe-S-cluster containining protein